MSPNQRAEPDARLYWREIQSPATRAKEPKALLDGARRALREFSNPHVRASALCVIIYRYLETPELRPIIRVERILDKSAVAARALENPDGLHAMRWALSLNMARANLLVLLGRHAEAVQVLDANMACKAQSLSLGQPFTNVVKSACAKLGIIKHRLSEQHDVQDLQATLEGLTTLHGEIAANYRYENHWVYEELALVYRLVFALAQCRYASRQLTAPTCAELMSNLPDDAIPPSFMAALRAAPVLPVGRSASGQGDDD
jgi:hypothetical protein